MPASILLAVTGGIAAYKAAALTSQLAQRGHRVRVIMTEAAQEFVGPATFRALSGQRVVSQMFDPEFALGPHIELARDYDILCVAPATASSMAKAAQGASDDLFSTLYLCFTGPVLMAPAMNVEMWNHSAVQRNVEQLRKDGVLFSEPGSGWLSCRTQGVGRMAEPEEILQRLGSIELPS